MLSEKIRGLLSTWMAGYARGLVNECADEAAKLERVARAAYAYDYCNDDDLERKKRLLLEMRNALRDVEHLL